MATTPRSFPERYDRGLNQKEVHRSTTVGAIDRDKGGYCIADVPAGCILDWLVGFTWLLYDGIATDVNLDQPCDRFQEGGYRTHFAGECAIEEES